MEHMRWSRVDVRQRIEMGGSCLGHLLLTDAPAPPHARN